MEILHNYRTKIVVEPKDAQPSNQAFAIAAMWLNQNTRNSVIINCNSRRDCVRLADPKGRLTIKEVNFD